MNPIFGVCGETSLHFPKLPTSSFPLHHTPHPATEISDILSVRLFNAQMLSLCSCTSTSRLLALLCISDTK